MLPIWIMGSNVDTSNPLQSPSDKLKKIHDEEKEKKENNNREKENTSIFDKINENIRGLVRGFTSLFGGKKETPGEGSALSNSNSNTTTNITNNSGNGGNSSGTTTGGSTGKKSSKKESNTTNSKNTDSPKETSKKKKATIKSANDSKKSAKKLSTKKKSKKNKNKNSGVSPIDKAVDWAVKIANDSSHGYDQSSRQGPNYDCSSFVSNAYAQAGLGVNKNDRTTGIYSDYTSHGFKDVTSETNSGSNVKALHKGDVLLNEGKHAALYIGKGKIVEASLNENGGISGGKSGDQNGKEIYVHDYKAKSWQYVLRPPGDYSDTDYNNTDSGTGSSVNGNTSFTIGNGSGVFDSKFAVSVEEQMHEEAEKYFEKKAKKNKGFLFKADANKIKKGSSGNLKTSNAKDMNSWKDSYADNIKDLEAQSKKNGYANPTNVSKDSDWDIIKNYNDNYNESNGESSISGIITADNISHNHKEYYENLVNLLKLIEKNTSNIPKTNDLLNEILKLIDTKEETELPDVNRAYMFGPIDPDVSLIATGI